MADAVIDVRELEYFYPGGWQALRGVNLALAAGERVALLGANGAGKSTLLLCLAGILHHQRGEAQVCGISVTKSSVRQVRQALGLVFQVPDDQLFCTTLQQDVEFGPRNMGLKLEECAARADAALRAVGLAGFGQRMGFHLSPGEKKRASIATVLSMEAKVLALDEPTSMLDPRGRRQLGALLKSLPQAQLIVTHDLELAREVCPRAAIMAGGKVVADGDTAALLADAALLDRSGLS